MILVFQVLCLWLAQQGGVPAAGRAIPPGSQPAVVTAGKTGLILYKGPSPLTAKVATLSAGTKATLVEKELFWALVQPEGSEIRGYVPLPRAKATAARPGIRPSLSVSPTLTAMATRGLRSVPAGFGKRWAQRKGAAPGALEQLERTRIKAARLTRFQRPLTSSAGRKPQEEKR